MIAAVVAVFGIPDPQWGELVMACVVLKPGMALSTNDLTTHCRQFLANYKIPRRVEFSDTELPQSGSGKILKRLLRERFWAHEERAVGLSRNGKRLKLGSPPQGGSGSRMSQQSCCVSWRRLKGARLLLQPLGHSIPLIPIDILWVTSARAMAASASLAG